MNVGAGALDGDPSDGVPKLKVGAGAGEGLAEGVELPKPLRFGRPRILVEERRWYRTGSSSVLCHWHSEELPPCVRPHVYSHSLAGGSCTRCSILAVLCPIYVVRIFPVLSLNLPQGSSLHGYDR